MRQYSRRRGVGSLFHRKSPCVLAGVLAILLCSPLLCTSRVWALDTLIPLGSTWSYLDDGTDPGSAWTELSFDDSAWGIGPAELGYGDGDEATVVSFGLDPSNKHITTYFRHTFTITDPSQYDGLRVLLRRDDGAIVHLNGVEVFRDNVGAEAIGSGTPAASSIGGADEDALQPAYVDPTLLNVGANVIAVEVHQRSVGSSDISFDLELAGHTPADPIQILRGPYLQRVGIDGAVIRWRTDAFTTSRVAVGTTTALLDGVFTDSTPTSDHAVEVTGLAAGTSYFYAVGNASTWFAGPDSDHVLTTSPPFDSTAPVRIWALGDSGTGGSGAMAVRDAYANFVGNDATDLILMLGDNAYDVGTDREYQRAVFDMYPSFLRTVPVWPTLGNHEGANSNVPGLGPYFEVFTLPTAGENGGLASGTESYYSFDHGSIHFVCLDSQWTDRAPGGAMLTWLENDLASTDREWIIAIWHHPPYSAGTHESDDPGDSGGRLTDMRESALPIIEAAGVDLVLCGHSHGYERTFLLDGHYGDSSTLEPSMILDAGDGDPTGDGIYRKPEGGVANAGTVYVVSGSAALAGSGPMDHPAMVTSQAVRGSTVIDIAGRQLDGYFLRETGAITDTFRLFKGPIEFVRGDSNGDGQFNLTDPILALEYLFLSTPVECAVALDANDDDAINIVDPIAMLGALFTGGAPPASPYPSCGEDGTPGALDCGGPPCP